MNLIEYRQIVCPYCGEQIVVALDCSAGDQDYIEDCQVCCCPIEFSLVVSAEGEVSLTVISQDE